MFDEFRLSFLRELAGTGIDAEAMQSVMCVVDRMGYEYDVFKKSTELVPVNQMAPRTMFEYLACRSLEGLSPGTLNNYRLALTHFLITVNKQIDQIETSDVRSYLYQYQMSRGLSNRSLDKLRTTLSGFFKWAVSEGKIERNPCDAIRPIRYTKRPRAALTQIELEYVRKVCGDIREKAIIETLYSTGCRVSELCNMKISDVDWDSKTVEVLGKGHKYRTCYINAKAFVTLKDYLARRRDTDEHLIVSDRKPHAGLTRYAVEHIVSEISNRAYRYTGKRISPHIFRHTTATTALQNGMPVQNVSRMLGHSQIETTMVYAEVNTQDIHRDHVRFVV